MVEIYVPIDISDVKNIIPIGEDIIYSTFTKGTAQEEVVKGTKHWSWNSHLLFTNNGIALKIPLKVAYKKKRLKQLQNPSDNQFVLWGNTETLKSGSKVSIKVHPNINRRLTMTFLIKRVKEFETKETFKTRKKSFLSKFRPIQSEKKSELSAMLYKLLSSLSVLPKWKNFMLDEENNMFDFRLFREVKKTVRKARKSKN